MFQGSDGTIVIDLKLDGDGGHDRNHLVVVRRDNCTIALKRIKQDCNTISVVAEIILY